MIALVWGGTLNSSAANLRTAVKGAASGTLNLFTLKLQFQSNCMSNLPKSDMRNQINLHFERKLWIRSQCDLKRYLPSSSCWCCCSTRHSFHSDLIFPLSICFFPFYLSIWFLGCEAGSQIHNSYPIKWFSAFELSSKLKCLRFLFLTFLCWIGPSHFRPKFNFYEGPFRERSSWLCWSH